MIVLAINSNVIQRDKDLCDISQWADTLTQPGTVAVVRGCLTTVAVLKNQMQKEW